MRTCIVKIAAIAVLLMAMDMVATPKASAETVYIWARKPAVSYWMFGIFLDHTYACVGSSSNCYTYPTSSTKTGGSVVTSRYGNKVIAETYGSLPMVYGVDGVCHQNTNRTLYAAYTTINTTVRGYSTSRFYFGTYGASFVPYLRR